MDPILSIRSVSKNYGGVQAVDQATFDVERGTVTSLIGPNGSGKSTLFNAIAGALAPSSGEIYFEGKPIHKRPPHYICKLGVGRTFQASRMFSEMTVLENLLVVSDVESRSAAVKHAFEMLDLVEIQRLHDELAMNLSYGQQKLLELARALMLNPRLLLLDEPFAGINPTLQDRLIRYLMGLLERGITIFLIDHEMRIVLDISKRVLVLDGGQIVADGKPDDIRTDPKVLAAYF